jgi:ribosomal protein S18 acetylase RimI-like enzyme
MVIERLAAYHNRQGFTCGVPELDEYFRTRVSQDVKRRAAAVFVLVEEPGSPEVLGFYTLSSTAIDVGQLPPEFLKKMPRYQRLPATLIGRLARRADRSGERLGEKLLVNALRRAVETSATISSVAVVVDAKEERARRWYEGYGFARSREREGRLWLVMGSLPSLEGSLEIQLRTITEMSVKLM